MENLLWKMMITNYKRYLRSKKETDTEEIDAFRISEILAIGTGKLKEDIMAELLLD